jgi:hypothetical protein
MYRSFLRNLSANRWIAQESTRFEIKRRSAKVSIITRLPTANQYRFRAFLESDDAHMTNIRTMCANNLVSTSANEKSRVALLSWHFCGRLNVP